MRRFQHSLATFCIVGSACLFGAGSSTAQSTSDSIAKYRELLADGNPADLWELRGQGLWDKKAGPNQANLHACDLGKGKGVLQGAYAELPRYFADTDKVMDLEQRLIHCRMTLQGISREDASKTPFGAPGKESDIEALVAYISAESKGMKMAAKAEHPQEQRVYEIGKQIFFHRAGPHDFACATCHGESEKRIRLQDLPNLLNPVGAQAAYTTWPAYRVSQGEVRTMQHRLFDCFRQQRFAAPNYASDSITALTMFLAKNAEGGVYAGPGLKR